MRVTGRPGSAVARAALVAVVLLVTIAPRSRPPPRTVRRTCRRSASAAEQSNLSPYPVLERLGLWQDGTFGPVTRRRSRRRTSSS
jgi:hypothetical protein